MIKFKHYNKISYNCLYLPVILFRPHEIKVLITKKRVNVTIAIIIAFFIIWDGEEIIRRDIVKTFDDSMNESAVQCLSVHTFLNSYQLFVKEVVTEVLASALPIAILIPTNTAVVVKVYY